MTDQLHLGKRPASPLRAGAIRYADVRPAFLKAVGALPPIPEDFGWGGDFHAGDQTGDWLMGANGPPVNGFPDNYAIVSSGGCGDCTIIGREHQIMEDARNGKRPVPVFSDPTTVGTYSIVTGQEGAAYDPETGANDNGCDIQDVVSLFQADGFKDDAGNVYKGGQALWATPGDIQELWELVLIGGSVGVGWVLTQANIDQFPTKVWDYVAGSPEVGGHYTPDVGRDNPKNTGTITWSVRHGHTRAMYEKQSDEAVLVIDPLEFNAVTGDNVEDYTLQDVEKYLILVGQAKFNS